MNKAKLATLLCAVTLLTGCTQGTDAGNNNSTSSTTTLPLIAYESKIGNTSGVSSGGTQSASGSTTGGTTSTSSAGTSESTSNTENQTDAESPDELQKVEYELPLVPTKGVEMPRGTDLTTIIINGTMVDISDITVQELVNRCGIERFAGYAYSFGYDYRFYGEGFFVPSFFDTAIHIEATKDGKLVEKNDWAYQDEDAEAYKDYKVKAVNFGVYTRNPEQENFAYFCAGVNISMTKEEIEQRLGRGVSTKYEGDELVASVSYYKNEKATLAIEYMHDGRVWSISVINND